MFALDAVPAARVHVFSYVVVASVGSRQGVARNVVSLLGPGMPEVITAFADVTVHNSILTDRAFITGRIASSCEKDADGVSQVRVMLEDGTFAISDTSGRFHFEDLAAGTHVVQLDDATLPEGMQTIACAQNSRMDKDGGVQFVDLKPGALGRVDFAVADAPPPVTEWSVRLDSEPSGDGLVLRLHIRTGALEAERGAVGLILPEELTFSPGTSRLNGALIEDPRDGSDGALTIMLPVLTEDTEHVVTMHARTTSSDARTSTPASTRAIVTLTTKTGKHRSTPIDHLAFIPSKQTPMVVQMSHEPPGGSSGKNRSTTGATALMSMPLPKISEHRGPAYQLPPIDNGAAPTYILEWLRT